jgi:hypothetical protein
MTDLRIIGASDDDPVGIIGIDSDDDTVIVQTLGTGDFSISFKGNSQDRRRIRGYLETERRGLKING